MPSAPELVHNVITLMAGVAIVIGLGWLSLPAPGQCRLRRGRSGGKCGDHNRDPWSLADKQLDQLQLKSRPHKVPSLVPESFITASGGSSPNPQLCWGLLADAAEIWMT